MEAKIDTRVSAHPSDCRSARRWQLAVCLFLVAAFLVVRRSHSKCVLPAGRHTSAWASARAVAVASLFADPIQVSEPPVLLHESEWCVTCRSEEKEFNLVFDDATGRLDYLDIDYQGQSRDETRAPVQSAAQAQEVALHWLVDLHVIPADSHTRLSVPPRCTPGSGLWKMIWRIQSPGQASVLPITTFIDHNTGQPLLIFCGQRSAAMP